MRKKTDSKKHLPDEERCLQIAEAWFNMVNSITHNITTPLVTARITAETVEGVLPELIEGYTLAVNRKLLKNTIPEKRLKMLKEKAVSNIKHEITRIIDFLKLLYPYNQKLFSISQENTSLSALSYLKDIYKKYPFSSEAESKIVEVKGDYDFDFDDRPPFMDWLFFNLMDNALTAIRDAGKGKISIWAEEDGDYNIIHFKDTGKGMNEDTLARVFYRFFSKRNNTTGPGLGFCRLALLQKGGDMNCSSIQDKHTDFMIKFPKKSG